MEIYKDLSHPATSEFEKLLNSQFSKAQIEEGKIIVEKLAGGAEIGIPVTIISIGPGRDEIIHCN